MNMIPARLVAVLAAVFWGLLFFGLIDLAVVPIQDERFYEHYLLETGWGLLYAVLVACPFVALAVHPRSGVFVLQVVVVAVSVLVCALVTPALGQAVPAVFLAASAGLVVVCSAGWDWRLRRPSAGQADWVLASLVLVAGAAAVWYAVRMVRAARSGGPDDDTWGLMHTPMQAAFGLALVGSAAVAVFAGARNAPDWRLSAVPASFCALWLGAVSLAYPDHLGSLGTLGGAAAVAWGVLFGVRARTRPSLAPAGEDLFSR
jgi:hypothetical protein